VESLDRQAHGPTIVADKTSVAPEETTLSEGAGKQEPPTYFANIVTLNITADETSLEFLRILTPHKEILKMPPSGKVILIPPVQPEQIIGTDPVVRVVLTYTAAQSLRQFLNDMLPEIERARKSGERPWQHAQR